MGKLLSGGGAKAARRAAEAANLKIDEAIVELRNQFQLDVNIRDADIARFGVELGLFNDQQFQELQFRRDLEGDRFQIADFERGQFQAKEQERFDLGQQLQQERLGIFDVGQERFEGIQAGQREQLQPFIGAGQGAIGQLAAGATAGGLDQQLQEILGSETFGALAQEQERGVQGALSAGGLTRSGTAVRELGELRPRLALQIQQQLAGQQQNVAGLGLQGAQLAQPTSRTPFQGAGVQGPTFVGAPGAAPAGGSGQQFGFAEQLLGGGVSTNIANLLTQQGQNTASGLLASAQAKAAGIGGIFGVGSALAKGAFTLGQTETAGRLAKTFFSDPRLKENIEQITQIGDLGVYQWDWIDAVKDTIVANGDTMGFMADEVEEKYPQHVGEFGSFKTIDYPSLLDELQAKYGSASLS